MGGSCPNRWKGRNAEAEYAEGNLEDFKENTEPARSRNVRVVDFEQSHEAADAEDGADGRAAEKLMPNLARKAAECLTKFLL